jgi:hypothetical protein
MFEEQKSSPSRVELVIAASRDEGREGEAAG